MAGIAPNVFSGPYVANGSQAAFPFTFTAVSASEVAVEVNGVDVSPSSYSVAFSTNGGTVTFSTPPAAGVIVIPYSSPDFTQASEFENQGAYNLSTVNVINRRSAVRDLALKARQDRGLEVPLGEQGFTLPAAASRNGRFLAFDAAGVPVASAGTGNDSALRTDLAASSGGALVNFKQAGTGAVTRSVQDKLRETISVTDYGAKGDGTGTDTAAILAAAVAARGPTAGSDRTPAGQIHLPRGQYPIAGVLQLAEAVGIYGLIITGENDGSTEIVFTDAAATISCRNSLGITFRDIRFTSALGVDGNQAAFTINYTDGNPVVFWQFERCTWVGFYKCFAVTGSAMCDGFHFSNCLFAQCYWLMANDNPQAVNWNFVDCNWVNAELTTVKTKALSSIFRLQKGTFVKWTAGSIISYGSLAYLNLTSASSMDATTHQLTFDGVRIERVDDGGTCAPLFDRPEDGTYAGPGNSPSVALLNATLYTRDTIPATVDHFRLWDNLKLVIDNCSIEGGKIKGVYSALTGANTGSLVVTRSSPLTYYEDVTNRVSDHIAHSVTIEPDTRGAVTALSFQKRSCSLSAPFSLPARTIYVRGPTGSLPLAGTTVNIPALPDHTTLFRLVVRKFATSAQSLTVALRDQADTTTYGTVTLAPTDRVAYGEINLEMGFQVASATPLMFKFTGTPEVVKGVVGLEVM